MLIRWETYLTLVWGFEKIVPPIWFLHLNFPANTQLPHNSFNPLTTLAHTTLVTQHTGEEGWHKAWDLGLETCASVANSDNERSPNKRAWLLYGVGLFVQVIRNFNAGLIVGGQRSRRHRPIFISRIGAIDPPLFLWYFSARLKKPFKIPIPFVFGLKMWW